MLQLKSLVIESYNKTLYNAVFCSIGFGRPVGRDGIYQGWQAFKIFLGNYMLIYVTVDSKFEVFSFDPIYF